MKWKKDTNKKNIDLSPIHGSLQGFRLSVLSHTFNVKEIGGTETGNKNTNKKRNICVDYPRVPYVS